MKTSFLRLIFTPLLSRTRAKVIVKCINIIWAVDCDGQNWMSKNWSDMLYSIDQRPFELFHHLPQLIKGCLLLPLCNFSIFFVPIVFRSSTPYKNCWSGHQRWLENMQKFVCQRWCVIVKSPDCVQLVRRSIRSISKHLWRRVSALNILMLEQHWLERTETSMYISMATKTAAVITRSVTDVYRLHCMIQLLPSCLCPCSFCAHKHTASPCKSF